MANIPNWVKEVKVAAEVQYGNGLSVKLVGGNYYLYKRTSHREKGKKNPQVVETYIGSITPEGLVLKERGLSRAPIDVYELGFSKVLLEICPADWKKALKNDWQPVLYTIIQRESPNSYLLRDYTIPDVSNRNINLQTRNLWDALPRGTRTDLEPLKRVYLVVWPDREAVSNITEEQEALAARYNVVL